MRFASLLTLLAFGCSGGLDAEPGEPAAPAQNVPGIMDPAAGSANGIDPSTATGEPLASDGSRCLPGSAPEAPLLRIDRTTYANALEDLFGQAAVDAIRPTLEGLPSARTGTFSSELAPPIFTEVKSYVDIASALAFELTKDQAALQSLAPCLANLTPAVDAMSDRCLSEFTETLSRRALRTELSAEKNAELLSAYSIGAVNSVRDGVATLLMRLLLDPQFLYFLEINGSEEAPGVLRLTPHELGARLARTLWHSVPDAELLQAVDQGLDAAVLTQQIERLWQHPRASAALGQFFAQWLELEKIPYAPQVFAPDSAAQTTLREAMTDEILSFVDAVVMQNGNYADLLLDRRATISNPTLAEIYGMDPLMLGEVTLPEAQRAGLLTRAGWLATMEIPGSDAGHVIKRGVKLSHFICQPLPPPDPGAFPAEDPADPATGPALAIRERFQAATAEPQCNSCHHLIDGYGAPFGNYGSAGQWIDAETISRENEQTTALPLDTQSQLRLDDEPLQVSSAVELSVALAESRLGAECLARQFGQSALGRRLGSDDACLVQAASEVLQASNAEAGSIQQALTALLLSDAFATRSLEPTP